jgi:hypothetical protein
MSVMALHDLLVPTFKNCSKICGSFNPLSIKILKKRLFEALLEI